jgi:hypothetical protein
MIKSNRYDSWLLALLWEIGHFIYTTRYLQYGPCKQETPSRYTFIRSHSHCKNIVWWWIDFTYKKRTHCFEIRRRRRRRRRKWGGISTTADILLLSAYVCSWRRRRILPLPSQWTQCHHIHFRFRQGTPWIVCGVEHVIQQNQLRWQVTICLNPRALLIKFYWWMMHWYSINSIWRPNSCICLEETPYNFQSQSQTRHQ